MYYINNANNRSLYHIKFFANNGGYQSCIVENLLQYVYHTSYRTTGLSFYRRAKKYVKFKNMRVSYNSYYNNYNLHRAANAIGTPNDSIYSLARKYGSSGSIFSCGTNTKRMSFNYMGYRYDHGMAQVEDFNNVNFVKHQL